MLEMSTNRREVLRNAGLVIAGAAVGAVAPTTSSFADEGGPDSGSGVRRSMTGAWKLHRVDPDAEYDGIWLFAAGGVATYQDIYPAAPRPLLGSWSEWRHGFRYELWVGFEADPATSTPALTAQVTGRGVRSGASFTTGYHVVFFDAGSGASVYAYDGSGTGVPL